MSTTQTITGALLAVGLMEGLKGVNWWAVLRVRPPPSAPVVRTRVIQPGGTVAQLHGGFSV